MSAPDERAFSQPAVILPTPRRLLIITNSYRIKIILHLLRPVLANAPVGDPQSQRNAGFLEEIGIRAVRPGVGGAEVVPARQRIARTDDIDGDAGNVEGGRSLVGGVEDVHFHQGQDLSESPSTITSLPSLSCPSDYNPPILGNARGLPGEENGRSSGVR